MYRFRKTRTRLHVGLVSMLVLGFGIGVASAQLAVNVTPGSGPSGTLATITVTGAVPGAPLLVEIGQGTFIALTADQNGTASVAQAFLGQPGEVVPIQASAGFFPPFAVATTQFQITGPREALLIQSFNESRSICAGSFTQGEGFAAARSVLAEQGYTFGAGVPALTPKVLLSTDIFVIGSLGTALSSEETCMLETYVQYGGAVLDVRNMVFPSLFGVQQTHFGGRGLAYIENTTISDVTQLTTHVSSPVVVGANSALTTGEGIPFLYDPDGRGHVGVLFPPTRYQQGRAVIIGDEEIFMNAFGSCHGAAYAHLPNNQKLLSNTFRYLAQAPGLRAGAQAALQACFIPECDANADRRVNFRDALAVNRYLRQGWPLRGSGDCNRDGVVDFN